ncbi:MAG: hypothetical protein ACFNKE_07200, partial [Neisseria elongata]
NIVGDDCTQHLLAAFLGCGCHLRPPHDDWCYDSPITRISAIMPSASSKTGRYFFMGLSFQGYGCGYQAASL